MLPFISPLPWCRWIDCLVQRRRRSRELHVLLLLDLLSFLWWLPLELMLVLTDLLARHLLSLPLLLPLVTITDVPFAICYQRIGSGVYLAAFAAMSVGRVSVLISDAFCRPLSITASEGESFFCMPY